MKITVEFDVPATMRDGTVLRANVFRPAEEGTYPVALSRTPYGKHFASVSAQLDAIRLARAGYIVVIQDVRGRFNSQGDWVAFLHEAEDGFDTVEWAAGLPGCNGNVGMFGGSYLGFTQWSAARLAPPHLKAIVPSITWADGRDGVIGRGGAWELGLMAYWQITAIALDATLRRHAGAPAEEVGAAVRSVVREIDDLRSAGYLTLPLQGFAPLHRIGLDAEADQAFVEPAPDGLIEALSVAGAYDRIDVPAYNLGGWYDIFSQGTLRNFAALRAHGATPAARRARVLIGPWSHVNHGNVVGESDFGFAAASAFMDLQTDLTGLTQRWFDYWLKGNENGVADEPPVKLFIMGENLWRDENEWPLARTQYTPYYLHAGDALSPQQPGDEEPDQYLYDPADPTPTHGGGLLMNALFGPGVKDQRAIEARDDVLVYTSEPLAQDTEVTGPVTVQLWAASDAPDTDFVARLVDVHPDGFARNLTDGIIRARYRNGLAPELLEPGRPYLFSIDLWSTANVFKRGHRIRLDVASANFPRWDRNPNIGGPIGTERELRPARQTILHDAAHPSHVVLPLIPR